MQLLNISEKEFRNMLNQRGFSGRKIINMQGFSRLNNAGNLWKSEFVSLYFKDEEAMKGIVKTNGREVFGINLGDINLEVVNKFTSPIVRGFGKVNGILESKGEKSLIVEFLDKDLNPLDLISKFIMENEKILLLNAAPYNESKK